MKITNEISKQLDKAFQTERRRWKRAISPQDMEDLRQDAYVRLLESSKKPKNIKKYCRYLAWSTCADFVRKSKNRLRLETENADLIVRQATPTLSDRTAGGPEEFVGSEQELRRRWATMTPLLRYIAKRSFFGVEASPQKIADELGTTVAAVNMARTRIKKHMNGVNE